MSSFFFLFIERLPNCYSVSFSPPFFYDCDVSPYWAFREHISHALPTKMIFYLLRSIRSEWLMPVAVGRDSMLYTLEIVIKWLQVSVSECN